ncbi:TTC28 [Branchiostoma lanceolatum]|uniref:TTC28 protein n=1 Tax=Branchiostoma lanceolatum TaxID=7740 RepID=A0A8J9YM18_BRALA|nr:TTC28 [Branchiostoma lanceolatum]
MTSLADKLQNMELCLKSQCDQEVSYGRALREAIVCMDPLMEVEVLKSLGDLHLQKGKLGKDSAEINKAAALYAAALLCCKDRNMGQTLEHRIDYMEKLSRQLLQGYTPHYWWLSSDYWGTADNNVLRVAETCNKLDRSNNESQDSVEETYTETLVTAIENSDIFLELEVLKSFGDFYLEKGRKSSDETQFSKAAAMYEKALMRCEDPETKQTLDHRIRYAKKIREMHLDRAEQHFAAVLKTVHILGQHREEAEPLYKLGDVYLKRGILSKDGSDFTKAAALCNAALLGWAWTNLGNHRKAVGYYEQSLEMERLIHGENTATPHICISLNNLGITWRNLGDHNKAISYHEQSLQMRQSIYGENTAGHPDIADSLNNLGSVWSHLGYHKKAISYNEQSLQMRRTVHGENTAHPNIASSLNNLGVIWCDLGDYRKAISYYEQSLLMKRTIYGEHTVHPDIADLLNNLGSAWIHLSNHKKAISYYEQSLQMKRGIYGENTAHPDVADSLNNLGVIWCDLGDYRKATSYYEQSLQMYQSINGEDTAHPTIASLLNNLGATWSKLGDHGMAIKYYEQSLQMKQSIYGTRFQNS